MLYNRSSGVQCRSMQFKYQYQIFICNKRKTSRKIFLSYGKLTDVKNKWNRAIKAFKNLLDLERNLEIKKYLNKLSATSETNYFLSPRDWNDRRHNIRLSENKTGVGWEVKKKRPKFAMHYFQVFTRLTSAKLY